MKIVLVQPRGSNWIPGQGDLSTVVNRMAPLGLLSLAAYLEQDGHEIVVYDGLGPLAPPGIEQDIEQILSAAPDLVGFSATTSSFLDAADMARAIKEHEPSTITVVGGVFVTSMGAGLLDRFDGIDYLVFGEGEHTLRELALGRPRESIRGLAYRENSKPLATPPRERIEQLDELPLPAYGLLRGFPRGYHLPLFNSPAAPGATMITSRGCPYSCSFCDRSVFGRKYRFQSADYVYEHMAHLAKDFGIRHINIYDDLFTLDKARVVALCERLIRQPLGLTFNCAVRVGHADFDIMSLLRKAGGWMVSLGIESGDPAMLKRHKSGVRLEQVQETVERLRQAGLRVKGLFIAGLPGETPETMARTLDCILSLDLDEMNLSKFTPFHGAPLWDRLEEEGTLNEDWRLMNCNNFIFVPKGFKSEEELNECYGLVVRSFYKSKRWRRRFIKKAWTCRHSILIFLRHLPEMLRARRLFESR
jgi:magnesium-protoporphyrin IX monomethyl ester (oxidative) cyclase